MSRHSTKLFSYDAKDKNFCSEASTLEGNSGRLFCQIYPDSCDEGFTLVSHKTGREIKFAVNEEHRNDERELQFYTLTPCKYQKLTELEKQFTITVFND